MMYTPALTDAEFLRWVYNNYTDPVVLRLLDLAEGKLAIIEDLVKAGMNREGFFDHDIEGPMEAGEYIQRLKRDVERADYDRDQANDEAEKLSREVHRLQNRSLAQIFSDYDSKLRSLENSLCEQRRYTQDAERRAEDYKSKLDTWTIIAK